MTGPWLPTPPRWLSRLYANRLLMAVLQAVAFVLNKLTGRQVGLLCWDSRRGFRLMRFF